MSLHQIAKDAGAAACLSVNPYYNKPTQEGLYRHFMTLADRVDLPIVLYNIPGRTGITMSRANRRPAGEASQTSSRSRKPPASLDMSQRDPCAVRHHHPQRRRFADGAAHERRRAGA